MLPVELFVPQFGEIEFDFDRTDELMTSQAMSRLQETAVKTISYLKSRRCGTNTILNALTSYHALIYT